MNIVSRGLCVAAIAASFSVSTIASAAAPEKATDRGLNASIGFDFSSEMICPDGTPGAQTTSGFVSARENVTRAGSNRTTAKVIELFIGSFNTCDFSFQSAFGFLENAGTYSQNRATSATIAGTIALFNSDNGMPIGNANISLQLTGTGAASQSTNISRNVFGSTTIISRSSGSFSDATASGSVTLNGQDLLAAAQNKFAFLGSNTSGTMIRIRATR